MENTLPNNVMERIKVDKNCIDFGMVINYGIRRNGRDLNA